MEKHYTARYMYHVHHVPRGQLTMMAKTININDVVVALLIVYIRICHL